MKRFVTFFAATVLCLACRAPDASRDGGPDAAPIDGGPTPDAAASYTDIGSELATIAAEHGLPALAAAASDDQAILAGGAAGVRKLGDPTPATFGDRWHLGSDTKAMTAVLIALHVEAGDLAWDDTLPELFPSVAVHDGYAGVTLAMLLSHSGGAPESFDADIFTTLLGSGASSDVRRDAVEMLLMRGPATAVGGYAYSNAGYVIAGAALEQRVGTPWEQLLRDEVFAPLDMRSCGFGPTATGTMVDGPWGHTLVGDTVEPMNVDNPASLGPAGTVHCSLADWLAFLREHLRAARGEPTTLPLSASAWTVLQTPASDQGNALGWRVVSRPWSNGSALVHLGSNTLNMADAWVVPGLNRIFVSVTNRGDDVAFDGVDAAIALLVTRFGAQP